MSVKAYTLSFLMFLAIQTAASGQSLDGSPYTPGKDADIDMFMGCWTESNPRVTHGTLIERDILTKGNALTPPRRGAVMEYVNRFAYGTLPAHNTTVPTALKGQQEAFYVLSGKGTVTGGGKTADLFDGICFFVPEGLEFTMTNTGDEPLTMYVISDPVPEGFKPGKEIRVKNENLFPLGTKDGHWCYQERDLLTGRDGLATIYAIITLTMDPMTIGHPHSHGRGTEEIWTTIKGNNIAFLGKQIRMQPPGTAYMIPEDGKTTHSNINQSKTEQVKMLYIAVRKDLKK
ncbi:MAG: cupin domain-containing protein [Candidatus Latescibacter sp.]|nr:cupin domain-containing protein [Candidatus Latescibacter sp.]